eukprot:GEMP01029983.1.p1 GENE.GEMP01029983.1~~GEMP01029983.1.p1  ORF type:complete len:248 (+),score=46.92 GEMP01029983.1:217-960(+)
MSHRPAHLRFRHSHIPTRMRPPTNSHANEPMHSQHRMRSFSPPDRHSPQTPPLQLPRSHILLPLAAHEARTSPAYPSPIASSSNAYLCPRPYSLSAPSRSAYPDTVPYRSTYPSACSHSTYPTEFGDGAARHAAPSSLLKNENYAGQARGSPPGLALHDLSRSAISPGVFGGAARGPPGYYQLPYETAPSSAARQYLPTYSPLREALPIDPVVTRACPNVYMPRDAFDYHASRMRKFFMRKDRGIVP